MDPREELRIQLMLDDELGGSDDSDEDIVETDNYNSESEESGDEGNDNQDDEDFPLQQPPLHAEPPQELPLQDEFQGNTNELYTANDGTRWRMTPQETHRRRRRRCDLLRHLPGVRGEARNARSPIEALSLFLQMKCSNSLSHTQIHILLAFVKDLLGLGMLMTQI